MSVPPDVVSVDLSDFPLYNKTGTLYSDHDNHSRQWNLQLNTGSEPDLPHSQFFILGEG